MRLIRFAHLIFVLLLLLFCLNGDFRDNDSRHICICGRSGLCKGDMRNQHLRSCPSTVSTRGNQNNLLAAVVQVGKNGNDFLDFADVDITRIVGEGGGAHLYNYSFEIFGCYFHNFHL